MDQDSVIKRARIIKGKIEKTNLQANVTKLTSITEEQKNQQINGLNAKVKKLEEETIKGLESKINKLEEDKEKATKEIAKKADDIKKLTENVKQLEDSIANYEKQLEDLQITLDEDTQAFYKIIDNAALLSTAIEEMNKPGVGIQDFFAIMELITKKNIDLRGIINEIKIDLNLDD